MSDISTGLIEFAEHKRLLFERIHHKLGEYKDDHGHVMGSYVELTDSILSDLYIESAETIDLHISLKGLKISDDKIKMKWMGLYTTALAKETHARVRWSTQLGNGSNTNEFHYLDYKALLSESKSEKDNLIALLDGSDKK